jgi:soluble P-type ATPase
VTDPIKPSAHEAVKALRQEGITAVMLTGDRRATAEAVAATVGIDRVEAEVLPAQKAQVVQRLQTKGHLTAGSSTELRARERVAMAGDGINDAPALAQADVGIAMGTGTDIAMESAAVTLVKGDLRGIVRARRLSRATMRNIRQNLFFAFVYNVLGVPVAAGVLYPAFGLLRLAAQSDDRERRDDVQLGVGDRQRASPAPCAAVRAGSAGPDLQSVTMTTMLTRLVAGLLVLVLVGPSVVAATCELTCAIARHHDDAPSSSTASCHEHQGSTQGAAVSATPSSLCHESGELPSAVVDTWINSVGAWALPSSSAVLTAPIAPRSIALAHERSIPVDPRPAHRPLRV